MKGTRLFLIACLVPLALRTVWADDAADVARAATRRTTTNVISNTNTAPNASRGKTSGTNPPQGVSTSRTTARERTGITPAAPNTAGVSARDGATGTRTQTQQKNQSNTAARTGGNVTQRAATNTTPQTRTTASRTNATTARAATTRTPQSRGTATTTARTSTASRASGARVSRAASLTREEILNRKYTTCRDVYYECMDEFCANKDAQLKRCACSSRINEFDKYKANLAQVDDKLLDFSQRLLTVSMDKEDAAAINTATEGETAFHQADKSASKKMLDEIAKKLNTSFDSAQFDSGANALNWSLNIDAAFDSVDSLYGASTTTKSGTALYSAALPICRDVALEVCSEDELAIAQSGYQVVIEQDCNTVAKTYETQIDQAHARVREGGALLDISRLETHQDRNSDDILTCKKKMLSMLSDTTVCGANLEKCLDTTGRYIDPTTGQAFLTVDLVNMASLIVRPSGNETWASPPANKVFISYLNSKKKYLEPAMEHCQDIADKVWDAFIEDALSQIKIAQDRKLEDMRQSCTTLTSQCLSDAAKSLADFDARALSIFGVAADLTVNAMCTNIRTACTALLDYTGGNEWIAGITEITTDTTYDTILSTCREVGRACIIQACRSITGNFGLCEEMNTSNNRKAIINRTSCWDEVRSCVASAGPENIDEITDMLISRDGNLDSRQTFYTQLYGSRHIFMNNWANSYSINNKNSQIVTFSAQSGPAMISSPAATEVACTSGDETTCIYDLCAKDCKCGENECMANDTTECRICRLTEKIWGNCEASPNADLMQENTHNQILKPTNGETTLLYWLAENTGTEQLKDSCRNTMCGIGYYASGTNQCTYFSGLTDDCAKDCNSNVFTVIEAESQEPKTNCCTDPSVNASKIGNVCCHGKIINNICVPSYTSTISYPSTPFRISDRDYRFKTDIDNREETTTLRLVCVDGTVEPTTTGRGTESEKHKFHCTGRWVVIDANDRYLNPGNGSFVHSEFSLAIPKTECTTQQSSTRTYSPTRTADGITWGAENMGTITGWHVKY